MSLRLRLVASIALALLATLGLGGVLVYWHAVKKVETEMKAAIGVGSRIAYNAVDDAEEATNPRRRLELLVADFDGDRHIRASLITPYGTVARSSTIAPPENEVPGWLLRMLKPAPERITVKLPNVFDTHGSIVLETEATNEITEAWEDARLYLGLLAGFSAAIVVICILTLGRVLAPIDGLQRAFSRIGSGQYEARVQPGGPPEIARLCSDFNEMGERLQEMDERTRRLREQLDRVQEEERADLARNLHDDMSPLLFSADVDAAMIQQFAREGDVAGVGDRVVAIRGAIAQMKHQVKAILGRLRPAILVDLGLGTAVDNLLSQWRARHPDVQFSITIAGDGFGHKLDGTLFHLIRESVSNALRHGRPANIEVKVNRRVASAVFLEVSDDGGGIDKHKIAGGFGIRSMHERTALAGGTISIQNRHDVRGVIVLARFPYASAAEDEEGKHAA